MEQRPGEPAAVEPRPAATAVVAREASGALEVLMVRRGPASRFAPGCVVFPGGGVDGDDADLARAWFGDTDEAARACAVRELAEEAGLAVTAEGVRQLEPGADALSVIGSRPPAVEQLPELARWIAPEFLASRFDARFFGVAGRPGLDPRPDGLEIDRAWWATPEDVLADFPLWEALMWPTYCTLRALSACRSVEEVLRLRIEQQTPPFGDPRSRRTPEWFEAEER